MTSPDDHSAHLPRRGLLGASLAALGAAACSGTSDALFAASASGDTIAQDPSPAGASPGLIRPGAVVLFQGDSITDAGRSREHAAEPNRQASLGSGYAWLAASGLLVQRPDDGLTLFNRGISGHKVFQLDERWDDDCLALAPDLVSILIGVNDIWHARNGSYDGTVEVYERDYHALLARTRAALPAVQLVVCEPFVLRCGAVDDSWFPEFEHYRAAAHRVADAHGARWVPFQAMFDRAVAYAPPEHWAADGVHPSSAGAALMAQTWLRAVGA